ncbi:MAG: hypothetical protein R2747_19860 [Pyrinomonadaceae bacterium]
MAFIDLDTIDPARTPSFYNVNMAVGYGCPNMEEDVKVVQFFLKRVFEIDFLKNKKPWGQMTIDGKVGPVTRAWIVKMQMLAPNVMIDGIVDKAGNENNPSNRLASLSHTDYTIRMINNLLRKKDTAVYKTLPTNPEVPAEMRLIFQQIHAAGPPMNFGNN